MTTKISKKETRNKIKQSILRTTQELAVNPPSKRLKKAVKSASRKISKQLTKELKKLSKKVSKQIKAKKGKNKSPKQVVQEMPAMV